MSRRTRFAAILLLAASLPLAAAPSGAPKGATTLLRTDFLPPDEQGLRQEQPEQQLVVKVVSYRVTLGNQRQSNQQPIPITTPMLIQLRAAPVVKTTGKGSEAVDVQIDFEADGKSLKKATYDEATRKLTLHYPQSQYRAVLDLLRSGTVFCQFAAYPNGHVWADLHLGPVRLR
ncbi:hypothetical protein [Pseudomonas solani]|uniref:hypothetical protein n=1 Tax=Pseudomonas solani TaxID=2731552 RepID=UPI003D6B5CF5